MNLSSLIIQVQKQKVPFVVDTLKSIDGCESHYQDDQQIIITIESDDLDQELVKVKQIEKIPGVIGTKMTYFYNETELDLARNLVDLQADVPLWLNDETLTAEQIPYHGDLRKKDL
jgi:nitrate reductase NapD